MGKAICSGCVSVARDTGEIFGSYVSEIDWNESFTESWELIDAFGNLLDCFYCGDSLEYGGHELLAG